MNHCYLSTSVCRYIFSTIVGIYLRVEVLGNMMTLCSIFEKTFLKNAHGIQDLSSLTKDQTHSTCSGNVES